MQKLEVFTQDACLYKNQTYFLRNFILLVWTRVLQKYVVKIEKRKKNRGILVEVYHGPGREILYLIIHTQHGATTILFFFFNLLLHFCTSVVTEVFTRITSVLYLSKTIQTLIIMQIEHKNRQSVCSRREALW